MAGPMTARITAPTRTMAAETPSRPAMPAQTPPITRSFERVTGLRLRVLKSRSRAGAGVKGVVVMPLRSRTRGASGCWGTP